jgi:hypothetical protein
MAAADAAVAVMREGTAEADAGTPVGTVVGVEDTATFA